MSSLVQAKCVSSAIAVEAELVELGAHEVLDGLDVVAGGGFEASQFIDLGLAEVGGEGAQRGDLVGDQRAASRTGSCSVRKISHSTSTCTRARLRPASERCSARADNGGAVAAVERAQWLNGQRAHGAP